MTVRKLGDSAWIGDTTSAMPGLRLDSVQETPIRDAVSAAIRRVS